MKAIPPEAVSAWKRVKELQTLHDGGEPSAADARAVRELVHEIADALGVDRLVEPHRVPENGRPWVWLVEADDVSRFELSRQIKRALDAAVEALPAEAAE